MTINFPNSPSLGQLYTFGETTWQWSGEYWNVYSAQTGYITSVSSAGGGIPVIESVTSNALTLKSFSGTNLTITDNNGLLNFYVPLNGGGGGQLYYFNISKTQSPYLELATTATTSAEQTITSGTSSGTTVTLGQFLTPSGFPGVSIIPGGVWSFYLHAYKQNTSASFTIYCDVYKRTTGGTETLILTTDPVPITANSPTPLMFVSDTYYSGTTLSTTDRLLVNVRATNTGTGTTNVTFVSEGTQHYSYMSSPLLLRTTDIYVDSFTYTSSANTITIGQTENYPLQTVTINSFSGLTITSALTVNTISATTYQNVNAVTGGSYSNGTITFSGTGNVNGTQITGLTKYFVSATTPTSTFLNGDRWFDTTNGIEFVYLNDGNSQQWVQPNAFINSTINGTLSATTINATIISATNYQNLPGSSSSNCLPTLYVSSISGCSPVTILTPLNVTNGANITGVTNFYNNVVFSSGVTISSSTNSTFGSLTATSINVNGNLIVTGTTTTNIISATTYQNLPTDITITGATYNNNTFTYTNNTGGTFNVLFNTLTGLTVNGGLTITGNTSLRGLTATTISATTYQNLPIKYYAEFSVAPTISPIVLSAGSISIGDGAESRSTYMLSFGQNSGRNATNTTYANFIGVNSGYDASGSTYSNFIGAGSGGGAINALHSNFIGMSSGYYSTGVTKSNFLGYETGRQSVNLNNSNVFGFQAGYGVTNATYVNFLGNQAGYEATNAQFSNFIGFAAGTSATNAQYSNFIGANAGLQATGASFSTFIGFNAGKYFIGNNVGSNNIIIGTNISLPNNTTNSLNIGGVLFGTGLYSTTGGDPSIIGVGGKIGINVVNPTNALDVGGNLLVTGTTTSPNFSGNSDTISGTKGSVTTSGSTSTAFINVSGSNTVGGANYVDFIRVTNTAAGATNPNKTIRVNNTGGIEFLNSAYNAVTLNVGDNGALFVGGGNSATVSSNDATTNYLSFNLNNSQIYDDGNTHIHARGNGNSMWINTNNAGIIIGGQSPVAGGGAASGIIMGSGSTTIKAFANIYGGKTYTIGGYGFLATIGAGTGAGTTATYGLYVQQRVEAAEFDATSDERLKNIQGEIELNDAINLVNNVKPIKFTWKDKESEGVKAGYSAQQVVKSGFKDLIGHIPNEDLIETTDDEGFTSPKGFQLTMSYDQVTPYHGVVLKHLLDKIEQLEKEIKQLKNKIG